MSSRHRSRRFLKILKKGGVNILNRHLNRVVELQDDEENHPEGHERLAARRGSKEHSPAQQEVK